MTGFSRFALVIGLVTGAAALASACGESRSDRGVGSSSQAIVSTSVVISQVYAHGGSGGATYTNDYVELFNMSATAVNIGGWSLQYAAAANDFSLSYTIPAGTTIGPGKYLLIQLAGGATGVALPTPDLSTTTINLAQAGGKLALVNNATLLTCGSTTNKCYPTDAATSIVDYLGYGTATDFEGAVAVAPTNKNALFRANGGCTDTDNNATDFSTAAAAPRNSATAAVTCAVDAGADADANDGADGADGADAADGADGADTAVVVVDTAVDAVVDAADTAPVDAGTDTAPVDTGAADTGTADTGAAPTDTGPADTGTAPTDTGTAPTDTGTAPTDTGTAPTDTGTAPEDTGTAPEDTGTITTDTGTVLTDTGEEPVSGVTDDSGCGCETPRSTSSNTAAFSALALGLAVAARRRRKS